MFNLVDTVKKLFESLPEDQTIDTLQNLVCSCGHGYLAHAVDFDFEDGSCRVWTCRCGKFEGS